jgi:RNA 3'-terminal phosphate cyclase (ATP)
MSGVVEIDGSFGEGGGQILRTALALSMTTGQPIRIFNIRAGRPNPGLANQHLTCIKAAREISSATVAGAALASQTLEFCPGKTQPGDYSFDVTTAGSVSLVFHTLFLPLSLAQSPSRVTIRGGTHVNWSPSYEFLEDQWLFYLRKIGFEISIRLGKAGYYPPGGGVIKARIEPAGQVSPLILLNRGELRAITGRVFFSNLKPNIAERQVAQAEKLLAPHGLSPEIEIREYPAPSPGTGTHLHAAFDNGSGSCTALGEKRISAEKVASSSAEAICNYIDSGAALDRFIADQLILPLSLASGESAFTCDEVSQHLLTNVAIVQMFLPVKVEVDAEIGSPGTVRIIPHPRSH